MNTFICDLGLKKILRDDTLRFACVKTRLFRKGSVDAVQGLSGQPKQTW